MLSGHIDSDMGYRATSPQLSTADPAMLKDQDVGEFVGMMCSMLVRMDIQYVRRDLPEMVTFFLLFPAGLRLQLCG